MRACVRTCVSGSAGPSARSSVCVRACKRYRTLTIEVMCVSMWMRACARTYVRTYARTYACTCKCANVGQCVRAFVCVRARVRASVRACDIYIYMHQIHNTGNGSGGEDNYSSRISDASNQ